MGWLLIIVGGLAGMIVGVAAVLFGVGSMLPSGHTASRTMPLPAPPDRVWGLITDWRAFPSWRKDVTKVDPLDPAGVRRGWIEHAGHGALPLELVDEAAPERLVMRIADPKLPFSGTWTYEIKPEATGCSLTITETGEVKSAPMRFMSHYFFDPRKTMDRYLGFLKAAIGRPSAAGPRPAESPPAMSRA